MYSYCNLIGAASSLAILISEDLSVDDISVLGCFFTTLGDNLALIASTKEVDNDKQKQKQDPEPESPFCDYDFNFDNLQ